MAREIEMTISEPELLRFKDKIVEELIENRYKIIEDFAKAYLAGRWEDYFSKQKKIDFRRVELVIRQEAMDTIYFFRLKKGKLNEKTR